MSAAGPSTCALPTSAVAGAGPRLLSRARFNDAYDRLIVGNRFLEVGEYYLHHRPRYRRTLEHLSRLPLPRPAEILEVGGGQIALLSRELFGDRATVADVNEQYADAVRPHGVDFVQCDLLRDCLDGPPRFDAIVLCEVVEHLPEPLHLVLDRLLPALRPGGWLLLTTPNLHRLRNLARLAMGGEVFCPFFYPEPGRSIGQVLEFSATHLRWQLERAALSQVTVRLVQLSNHGSSLKTHILRLLAAPLLRARPLWRDGLIAWGQRPVAQGEHVRSPERSSADKLPLDS